MTASAKRCPRCGKVKPADQFYRRRHTRLSSYCQPCQRRRQDPAAAGQLRAVDRARQRRHRTQGPGGGDAA
jgi:hypothetical protein